MRGQAIIDLLQSRGPMRDVQVAAELGLKIRDCRARLNTLLIHERLETTKIGGSRATVYQVRSRIDPFAVTP